MSRPKFLRVLKKLSKLIKRLSILFRDWLRYELSIEKLRYLKIRNRMERLAEGPIPDSYVCLWPYTSRLSAVEAWPFVGKSILKRASSDYNFKYADVNAAANIEISVIIGHRGLERLDLLLGTIKSIAAQKEVGLECIVVEQDSFPQVKQYLPNWVRYVFQETTVGKEKYNRSAAFNLGSRQARGSILLLHDNDMIIPTNYCYQIVSLNKLGYEVLNIKRFIFYLSVEDTQKVLTSLQNISSCSPLYIVQNLEAGGSVAITKEGYKNIGGMDEDFVGWGGEDNEFWERCSQLRRWIWGFSVVIHLWHQSQPLKLENENKNVKRARDLAATAIEKRIERLKSKNKLV